MSSQPRFSTVDRDSQGAGLYRLGGGELGRRDTEDHACDLGGRVVRREGDEMVSLAACRDHVGVGDLQRPRRIARQGIDAAFEQAAEGGELHAFLLQRAVGEKPDVGAHPFLASSVNACAKASREPARPVSLKMSAVSDCTEASSIRTPLLVRKVRAAATASSIAPPAL